MNGINKHQTEILEFLRNNSSKFLSVKIPRGFGKTYGIVIGSIEKARKESGSFIYIITKDYDQTKNIINAMCSEIEWIDKNTVVFPNKSIIQILPRKKGYIFYEDYTNLNAWKIE